MKPEIEPFPEVLKTLPGLKIRLRSPENWHGKEGPPVLLIEITVCMVQTRRLGPTKHGSYAQYLCQRRG